MTILAAIRRNRRSAILLSVAVFAWLSVLVTPCAMGFLSDTPSTETVTVIGAHAGCNNAKLTKPMADSNCCCNLTTVVSGDAPQLVKLVMLIALPLVLVFDLFIPTLSNAVSIDLQRSSLHETSPPVYLATQRLRI